MTWIMNSSTAGRVPGFLLLALLLGGVAGGRAQEALRTQAKGFQHAEPHPRPNEGQTKFLLQGGETRSLGDGRSWIAEPKLESFRVDGQREFMVQAREGVFDPKGRMVTSDGTLEVILAGDRFHIGGRGYRIEADQSFLVISNDVTALVYNAETNGIEGTRPLEIRSERFEFDASNRHGIFIGSVRGEDEEFRFSCGRLSAKAAGEDGTFDVIEAEEDVVIEGVDGNQGATAARATYREASKQVELEGGVTWRRDQHEGRADRLVYDRPVRGVEAIGNVAMKLPRESLSVGRFFVGETNRMVVPGTVDETKLVDLECDRFISRTNVTEAIGNVRIVDQTNRLSCDVIKSFDGPGTNAARVVLAEGRVVVEQGSDAIRSERALYTETNSVVLFTGQPSWSLARTRGKARRITMNAEGGSVFADGDVEVQVPVGGGEGSFLKMFPGGDTGANAEEQMVLVFAREFDADEKRVMFGGSVRAHEAPITGREPRLTSGRMEVAFAQEGQGFERITAREDVVFEQGEPGVTNGAAAYQRLESDLLVARALESGQLAAVVAEGNVVIAQPGSIAHGDRAEYDGLDDRLRLTGGPTLTTPEAVISEANVLIYDRANERFTVTAPYRITLKQDSARGAIRGFRDAQ